MMPDFRMHLRAHGTVASFFAALKDAPSDPVSEVNVLLSGFFFFF
jgi:hypothetical protein